MHHVNVTVKNLVMNKVDVFFNMLFPLMICQIVSDENCSFISTISQHKC